jgi:hypothetical protein
MVTTAGMQPENSDTLILIPLSTPLPLKSARFVAYALACTVSAVWLLKQHHISLKNSHKIACRHYGVPQRP